ncbi:threonine synthase [Uncinocarpus reesii 1704]|uniref:Threonine synthase n=1 Tax=Uncinocarpus reesii (strain UAMH 1704) TaxID=336963 RepID=C4JTQ2_UNCRE|nr:threonine synthase [Uncinocarpus reesii 1704]EEP80999.1 threonine synthase [Uncinocarpus reesii 1704]
MSHTDSQRYLSTRGGSYDLSFEEVVLKGLASDGGLFIPEAIPSLPSDWQSKWRSYSFQELAFEIFSLYISPSEIPPNDLKDIIARSYGTFRAPDITPLVTLEEKKKLYLLELFCGPTFAFKDVALQFLGNLFEYFLVRRNQGKTGKDRHHLVVVSPIQEAQMTTVLDSNVHNLSVEGSFDDCQDIVKALFADPEINRAHKLAAVNSINFARILAQMTYYFHSYFQLIRSPSYIEGKPVRFVVPSGNFGDILAGWFAKEMGLPAEKLVIATNENDILDRFWKTGAYTKQAQARDASAGSGDEIANAQGSVKETLSPAMDILVSSNFERLLWYLAFEVKCEGDITKRRASAGETVRTWLNELKTKGGFSVDSKVLSLAQKDLESERVSDDETIETIRYTYSTCFPGGPASHGTRGQTGGYILDPHSAVGVAASLRSISRFPESFHISLSTAHPAKFAQAVDLALRGQHGYSFDEVLPPEFVGLEHKERRIIVVPAGEGWQTPKRDPISKAERPRVRSGAPYGMMKQAGAFPLYYIKHRLKSDLHALNGAFANHERAIQTEQPQLPYNQVLKTAYERLAIETHTQPQACNDRTATQLLDEESSIFAASISTWPAFHDTVDAMRRLKTRFKLVPISNVDRASFDKTLRGPLAGVHRDLAGSHEPFFDAVYTAQDIGSYKPDLRNFEYLISRAKRDLGVEKDDILHVAQSLYHDHEPAKKVGLNSVWIARGEGGASAMGGEVAEYVATGKVAFGWKFASLGELADAIDKEAAE